MLISDETTFSPDIIMIENIPQSKGNYFLIAINNNWHFNVHLFIEFLDRAFLTVSNFLILVKTKYNAFRKTTTKFLAVDDIYSIYHLFNVVVFLNLTTITKIGLKIIKSWTI